MNELIAQALGELKIRWEKESDALEKEVNSHPSDEFFAIHDEFKKLLESGANRLSKEFNDKISKLAERERKAKKAMKAYVDNHKQDELIERRIRLNSAIGELANMLYYHNDAETRRLRNIDNLILGKTND